jgi:hypothetical protein
LPPELPTLGLCPLNYQKGSKRPILLKYAYNTLVTCHFSIKKIFLKKLINYLFIIKKKKEKGYLGARGGLRATPRGGAEGWLSGHP